MTFDAEIAIFIQRFFLTSTLGIGFAVLLSRYLIFIFIPVLVWLSVYGDNQEKHAVKEAAWSMGVAILIAEIFSLLLLRIRPFLSVAEIVSLIPPPLTSAFPSTHVSIAIAATAALFSVSRRWGYFCAIIALGIAIGRVAAGVHYPSDIIGGMLVGVFAFAAVRLGHKALRLKTKD
ncbi:MAG: phosphatase PAP2 family protein [Patescibacteria group bacterium]|nr:phosphatase PAP2 family protein [Patescibacteria group bacterium]